MNNKFSNTYFVSRALFLGLVYSKMFGYTQNDSVISCFLGMILGLIIIIIINKTKINNIYHKIVYFILITLLIILGIVIGVNFGSYFFFTKTPRILIVLPAMIICIYIAIHSKKSIDILSFIQLYFSLTILLITFLVLLPNFTFDNFFPLLNHSVKNISKSAFIFGVYSSVPNILLIEDNIPLKKHLKYYVLTSLVNIIICIFIIGTLKPSLLDIYSFPEYMALKNIRILGFIENIENFLASIWLFDIFFMLSLANKKIYELFNSLPLTIIYISILTIFTSYIIIPNYNIVLIIYYYASLALFILILLLSIKSNVKYK